MPLLTGVTVKLNLQWQGIVFREYRWFTQHNLDLECNFAFLRVLYFYMPTWSSFEVSWKYNDIILLKLLQITILLLTTFDIKC